MGVCVAAALGDGTDVRFFVSEGPVGNGVE